ncbi:MAG: dihydrolipoyllysine-residue acetyltransferase [Gammaproteobacteria bacterium]|nr:MAG: dihydrolipoyllysine-residue acetyltransferase [Gammaproteobacteria bacterium]
MTEKTLVIPDIGDFPEVEVIEVLVAPGDRIAQDDSLITLESDKAAMEIPATDSGIVKALKVQVGDKVKQGDAIVVIKAEEAPVTADDTPSVESTNHQPAETPPKTPPVQTSTASALRPAAPLPPVSESGFRKAHASPSVRKFARELGVDLGRVPGSGPKNRILIDDVQDFVKQVMAGTVSTGTGFEVAPAPDIDFSEFGAIDIEPLTRINKLTGLNLHRNWVTVPHVTQFDEADITDLEAFRKEMLSEYKDQGIKITLLSFLIKAVVSALKKFPRFNSSLDASGENLILKHYIHIGIAVDTPGGLVVPVVKNADCKSLIAIAEELGDIGRKARERKLRPDDLKGGCFSISSLGGLGGTAFTPIINSPEVAILGISRAQMKPVWQKSAFTPRLMLPMSLSYDHRVIDGANGVRFTGYLCKVLSDARRMLL